MKSSQQQTWMVFKDVTSSYMISDFKQGDINYIIDIGANIGMFSIYSRFMFPKARIIAIEPDTQNHLDLVDNTMGLKIECIKAAYGDGRNLYLRDNGGGGGGGGGSSQSFEDMAVDDRNFVHSMSLNTIFKNYNISTNQNYIIKMDCEGGERFLLNGNDNDIVQKCNHFCMEIHFPNSVFKQFSEFPSYETYNTWVEQFTKTHKRTYHRSSRKRGLGVYVLSMIAPKNAAQDNA